MEISEDDNNLESQPQPILDPPREHLVRTALKFLQNPKVRKTSLTHKQNFLRQKGLTDEEIRIACEQAGLHLDEHDTNTGHLMPFRKPMKYQDEKRLSLWVKAKDIANLVALVSIGSYSLYSFWKSYIAPRFFGARSLHEQNYEKLVTSVERLNASMDELKDLLRALQQQQQSNIIQQHPGSSFAAIRPASSELQDLRNELASIKGLLLNRSQFPSSPGIPSWQMLENEELEESEGGESTRSSGARRERKSSSLRKVESETGTSDISHMGESADLLETPSTSIPMRKHPSLDSNNGFHSGGSSCEVVFLGKNDSSSDPDHSDD